MATTMSTQEEAIEYARRLVDKIAVKRSVFEAGLEVVNNVKDVTPEVLEKSIRAYKDGSEVFLISETFQEFNSVFYVRRKHYSKVLDKQVMKRAKEGSLIAYIEELEKSLEGLEEIKELIVDIGTDAIAEFVDVPGTESLGVIAEILAARSEWNSPFLELLPDYEAIPRRALALSKRVASLIGKVFIGTALSAVIFKLVKDTWLVSWLFDAGFANELTRFVDAPWEVFLQYLGLYFVGAVILFLLSLWAVRIFALNHRWKIARKDLLSHHMDSALQGWRREQYLRLLFTLLSGRLIWGIGGNKKNEAFERYVDAGGWSEINVARFFKRHYGIRYRFVLRDILRKEKASLDMFTDIAKGRERSTALPTDVGVVRHRR